MTGQILLAWLKLLALDGNLARAEPQDAALPGAARRRPARARRPETAPEDPGGLAVGRGDHRRMAARQRAPATPLTSAKPSPRSRKDRPRARGPPATRPASRAVVIPRR